MTTPRIVLAGLGSKLIGLSWESNQLLRIGRQSNLEVVLRDYSVERCHAEVKNLGLRWVVRDLADSPLFPTLVNDVPVTGGQQVLRLGDVVQVGKVLLKVADLQMPAPSRTGEPSDAGEGPLTGVGEMIALSDLHVRVEASVRGHWDDALRQAARPGALPAQGDAMLTLLRANHHLAHLSDLDELLRSILTDTIATLGAQRGTILLADPRIGVLTPRATRVPGAREPAAAPAVFSATLARRCFHLGESLLCHDVHADSDLQLARSVRRGSMSSIVCALLRTPRTRLGVLQLDRGPLQEPFVAADLTLADAMAASVAVGIESAQSLQEQRSQFLQTVTTLARAVEMRDQYTGDHTRRVTEYALTLAAELNVPAAERQLIEIGSPLHDLGKIGIDDAILRKPGKLTADEFAVMKTHTLKGVALLEGMGSLASMVPIIRHHHERWDGLGYPDGLRGEAIPRLARIVAVADAFDAMTSDRPYRPALPAEQAYLELIRHAGSHFDPSCVQAFLRARRRVEAQLRGA